MPKIETKIALESWIVFDIYLNSIYKILPGFPCIWNWHICYQNYILNTVFKLYSVQEESTGGCMAKFFFKYHVFKLLFGKKNLKSKI